MPGRAAEAAFWALLSLTPLLLVLIGALGYLTPLLGAATMAQIENRIITAAGQGLDQRSPLPFVLTACPCSGC